MQYRHPTIPITAERFAWAAAGYTIYENSDTVGSSNKIGIDEILAQSLLDRPEGNTETVLHALREHDRRREERTRVTAQARDAEAIRELATACRAEVVQKTHDDSADTHRRLITSVRRMLTSRAMM